MANEQQLAILRDSVKIWNLWRKENANEMIDLSWADLFGVDLRKAELRGANLSGTNLIGTDLREADLSGAKLYGANLGTAELAKVKLIRADLSEAILYGAKLGDANLSAADLSWADLREADLSGADLSGVNLSGADLRWANLNKADLTQASFVGTRLQGADLKNCRVFGVSAWSLELDETTIQTNLCITPEYEPDITVDNLEVAQFLYLMLHNEKVRAVLDTITSKVVLLLGRFGERRANLEKLREALRHHPNKYIPVLFDFKPQRDKPVLETVKILANLARFIIADLTDPHMIRAELTAIIPSIPTVPVQSIVEGDAELPTEYDSWALYQSFLPVYRYTDVSKLLTDLESVLAPVESHVQAHRIVSGDPTE